MNAVRNFRHRLSLETMICWRGEDGREHTSIGATRDVNAQGAYLYVAGERPPTGAVVAISALLPAFLHCHGLTYLRGPGIVVRADEDGFALRGNFRIETEYTAGSQPSVEWQLPLMAAAS